MKNTIGDIDVVRIKLGPEREASPLDPLGRSTIGFAAGLSEAELWLRGRGVWKARLQRIASTHLALVVADGVIVCVGAVDGVTFHGDRVAIEGSVLPGHAFVGRPDPLANESQNPVAYGLVSLP